MKLMGAVAVQRRAVLGLLHRADAAEPLGRRAQAVAVVVEQSVLGSQSAAAA
jgi:hypothetical protein